MILLVELNCRVQLITGQISLKLELFLNHGFAKNAQKKN